MARLLYRLGLVLSIGSLALALPRGVDQARVFTRAEDIDDEYDYIIVGGGTSGLTVAHRLTEDEDVTVLVVEYGIVSDSAKISTIQGGFNGVDGEFLYSITSAPQVNLGGRSTAVLAGKVVGGSSAVNALMTVRGTTGDYDRWGKFFSDDSTWSWDGMLPYFKRALHFAPPNEDVAKSAKIVYDESYWDKTSGVYAGWPSFQYPGTTAQFEAFAGVPGIEFPPDSGAGIPGAYWYPTFMDPVTATRSYARTGHYDDVNKDNYHLVTGSKVNRILLDGTKAVGVSFVPASGSGEATEVKARKEVILAAGAVHTPQIMQLSGLGPKSLLDEAGIDTVVDLPGVGQNFQDHPMLTARFNFRKFDFSPSSNDLLSNAEFRSWAQEVWAANNTGPYSIATGNAAAWLSFPVISERYEEVAADLEAQDPTISLPEDTDSTVVAGYKAQMQAYAEALRSNHTAFYNLVLLPGPSNGILVDLHPLSRGTVNIDLRDPEGREPIVDYRAMSNPMDAVIMADILRFTRKYYLDNEMTKDWDPVEIQPGARVQSDEDFQKFLSQTLSPTEYHPAGTCAMMPLELGGVVDEELKVYGVEGLRIVDASILPTLPGANTCQTMYAVAEKAADIIKGVTAE